MYGILKKDTYLFLSDNISLKIPKNTKVAFSRNPPTVFFINSNRKPIKVRKRGVWFIHLFGDDFPLISSPKLYPFSYFKEKS